MVGVDHGESGEHRRAGWSRGLTAETDARVARMAAGMRGRTGWATGKTAATDPRIARGVEKRRGVKRGMYKRHREALGIDGPLPCGREFLAAPLFDTYVYMLGMFLGDGYLHGLPGSCRLEIALDAKYPALVETCAEAMSVLYPDHKVTRLTTKANCVVVYSYGWRWLALFPHSGSGRKHLRRIELAEWQQELVRGSPLQFIRGLIESDGCRSVRHQDGHEYPFYSFDNRSTDIIGFFCWACDLIGIHYTKPKPSTVSIARRPDVAFLDQVIGRKC